MQLFFVKIARCSPFAFAGRGVEGRGNILIYLNYPHASRSAVVLGIYVQYVLRISWTEWVELSKQARSYNGGPPGQK